VNPPCIRKGEAGNPPPTTGAPELYPDHATYVFGKPGNMVNFLALYSKAGKEHVRRNRDNVGERLGFLGRVIHGTNPRTWLKEMRQRLGEKIAASAAFRRTPAGM
jgi:hypothetical protein